MVGLLQGNNMDFRDLILAVKEEHLTKTDLEQYRDDLANITADFFIEMADLEKLEALFPQLDDKETEANRKRRWKMTVEGQRQITLKNYIRASKEILSSLRNRLYNFY